MDGRMDRLANGQTVRRSDRQTVGRMDGWTVGRMDGWTDGWTDIDGEAIFGRHTDSIGSLDEIVVE